MIELNWYRNADWAVDKEMKWYVRPVQRQTLDIRDLARHLHEHNTPFSAGTIEGLITDLVECIREQLLEGNAVKIDNLAIFKLAVHSRAYDEPGGGCDPRTGRREAQPRLGSAVKEARLTAQPTGDCRGAVLGRDARFGWSTEARAMMEPDEGE